MGRGGEGWGGVVERGWVLGDHVGAGGVRQGAALSPLEKDRRTDEGLPVRAVVHKTTERAGCLGLRFNGNAGNDDGNKSQSKKSADC